VAGETDKEKLLLSYQVMELFIFKIIVIYFYILLYYIIF
jgi:hypothetical protein